MAKFLGAVLLGAVGLAANASATLINFDSGQANGSTVGSFYSGLGVTFSNASWTSNFGLAGSSGSQGINSISDGYEPQPGNPIKATFSFLVSTVTLRGIDVGAMGYRLKAYNAADTLIDNQVAFGTDVGDGQFFDLTVNGLIKRIEFSQDHFDADVDEGILFDNLSFTAAPVPEPATLAALGFGAVAFLKRRRK